MEIDMTHKEYKNCTLCMRACGVDRTEGQIGACGMSEKIKLARAALHFWEEPIISGTRGSGAIFFSGCSLSCVFCQNREISKNGCGIEISEQRLSKIMLELEEKGAHNINLVTATHFSPSVRSAVLSAKKNGLKIPIVYNTSSYDTKETLKSYEGLVDIYLPDYKYFSSKTARLYSSAANYPEAALGAIDEMVRQKGNVVIENGIMTSGVIIRLLELPQHVAEAKLSLGKLYRRYGDKVYYSLMCQYTPTEFSPYPINRTLTRGEYREFTSYAEKLGIKNAFVQDFDSASEEYIPDFDYTGVIK
jgi:putative pyruvate formate lyase activating enzyme